VLTSRYFGPIAPTSDYASTELPRAGEPVRVDINIANPAALEQSALDAVDQTLDELDALHAAAVTAFAAVMDDDASQPAQFWQFHHDDVEGYGELERSAFTGALRLERAGFYPDGAFATDSYVILDYALRGPPTDQLLVAKFLRDRSLLTIAWES
jgi:hypothetical protein